MKRPWSSLEPHHSLSRQDAADYLGISDTDLDKLVLAGELTPARIGRRFSFKVEQLHWFFREHMGSGTPKFFFWNRRKPQLPMEVATQLLNLPKKDIVRLLEAEVLKDLAPQSIRSYLFESQWQAKLLQSNQG